MTDAEKVQWAQDTAHGILMTQFDLGGVVEDEPTSVKRLNSDFAFGYIVGFSERLLHVAGVVDDQVADQVLFVFTRLFGPKKALDIFDKCMRIQENPEFLAARLLGAEEVREWLAQPKKTAPTGLAQYLSKATSVSS